MKFSRSRHPAVDKLLAGAAAASSATSEESSPSAGHDPALLKALTEASAWIVTLHGPERTAAVERGFQRWLAESPRHRYAFEHATETWDKTRAAVRRSAHVDISAPSGMVERPRKRARVGLAIAASVLVAAIGIGFYVEQAGFSTGVGERRTVVLDDKTQVTLNTATRITVDYNEDRRLVHLESGEALFEVAKHPEWPFVVTTRNREVTALGTSFLVRSEQARLAVTLLEGKVRVTSPAIAEDTAVTPALERGAEPASTRPETRGSGMESRSIVRDGAGADSSITLVPGERVVFADRSSPVLDRPELQKLIAWQQGLVNIDDLTLAQAAEEMNRYNNVQLVVEGAAAAIRVSGVFRVTDSENLAQAVALTHGLDLHKQRRRIVLSGAPQRPSESRFGPAPRGAQAP